MQNQDYCYMCSFQGYTHLFKDVKSVQNYFEKCVKLSGTPEQSKCDLKVDFEIMEENFNAPHGQFKKMVGYHLANERSRRPFNLFVVTKKYIFSDNI